MHDDSIASTGLTFETIGPFREDQSFELLVTVYDV